ncbi:hypothetical protein DIPPA_11033 [Diplonema papillatum]|nr:hypothetical protein DIPPA_11033 [Diplonema papillatum]
MLLPAYREAVAGSRRERMYIDEVASRHLYPLTETLRAATDNAGGCGHTLSPLVLGHQAGDARR